MIADCSTSVILITSTSDVDVTRSLPSPDLNSKIALVLFEVKPVNVSLPVPPITLTPSSFWSNWSSEILMKSSPLPPSARIPFSFM